MDGFHDGWLQDLSLNLIAPLYSARMASKMWCDADKPGVLVFTVSYYAYAPCPLPVYGLSKCALNHFAMNISSMSKEGFPIYKNFRKIRMNTITPGGFGRLF
jgi:NAD(P)-dependent dehydrogenase (short-subunit alcohol dehydrogenase family)